MPVVSGFSGDSVDGKLVDGLARPGRNFTGMSYLALALVGKRIELLKEWLPQLQHVAILAQPQHPGEQKERQASEEAVAKLRLSLSYYPISGLAELDNALSAIQRDGCDALVVFPDSTMFRASERIAGFALAAKLPSVSGWAPFAESGLLLTYGPHVRDLYRSLARYVDRILRGAKAADLPVELPSAIELVINLKTARRIARPRRRGDRMKRREFRLQRRQVFPSIACLPCSPVAFERCSADRTEVAPHSDHAGCDAFDIGYELPAKTDRIALASGALLRRSLRDHRKRSQGKTGYQGKSRDRFSHRRLDLSLL
jgi:hypothetical protein